MASLVNFTKNFKKVNNYSQTIAKKNWIWKLFFFLWGKHYPDSKADKCTMKKATGHAKFCIHEDVKILNKIPAHWIQQYGWKDHSPLASSFQGCKQGWHNIHKPVNGIRPINKRFGNCMIISTYEEKAKESIWQNTTSVHDKNKVRFDRPCWRDKALSWDKPTADLTHPGEQLSTFPLRPGTRMRWKNSSNWSRMETWGSQERFVTLLYRI